MIIPAGLLLLSWCCDMKEPSQGRIFVRVTPEERMKIMQKMELAGVRKISAYMRKMAIDGHVIMLDLTDIKEVERLLGEYTDTLKKFEKKAEETGCIYLQDIKQLQTELDEIWETLKEILFRLSFIK